MNYCKECKHCVIAENPEQSKCLHPSVSPSGLMAVSLVTGNALPEGRAFFCSTERGQAFSYAYPCGSEGKLFEPISAPAPKSPAPPKAIGLEGSETARD